MEPVTVTITDEYVLAGYHRIRCHAVAAEIHDIAIDLADGNIIAGSEAEQAAVLLDQLEAALAALKAIDRN
jgi:hypothetical protein